MILFLDCQHQLNQNVMDLVQRGPISRDTQIITIHWPNSRNVCLLTYRPAATIKHYIPFSWD